MIEARSSRRAVLAAICSVLPFSPALKAWQREPSTAAVDAEIDESEPAVVSEEIEVIGDEPVVPAVRILSREEMPEVPIGDGADLLRGVAGVAVGRMGGHGLEPRMDDDPTTGSGQDYGETPGYGVLDLSSSCRILGSLSIFARVDNVFDRTYANHLNRANLFDPEPVQINEPGRTLWIRLAWRGGAL